MVFSSLPLYHFDPPNWNQPNQQPPCTESPLLSSPLSGMTIADQPAQNQTYGGVSRPGGSMAQRARLAKIPQREAALNCPRCYSTNTKFCYFNNHSLSQPRHFCRTCRRYWTLGGALRDVPVGGGSRRRNRRSSSSNEYGGGAGGITSSSAAATSGNTVLPSNFGLHDPQPFLRFLADQYRLGLNFSSLQQQPLLLDAGDYGNSTMNGLDEWSIQQFPFLEDLDTSSLSATQTTTTSGLITQLESVMMEDSQPQAALRIPGDDQFLGGGWVGDLSGLNPSWGGIL